MSYCIYLRKSRADLEAEARGEGETLARHKKALLEIAKRQRLNVTQIHQEIVSGETIASRPVMQQLLSEVEQGIWKGVLVMEVERLARGDTIDQGIVAQAFKYSDTKIITPIKNYDPNNEYDEEYFEFGLFMSRREYKTTNRRMQRGRIASVNEGKFLGTKPPYGYVRKKLDKQKGYTLDVNDEQANIVKMIFELYTKGYQEPGGTLKRLGVSLIVRKLNDLRIPPMKGDIWVPATIQGILHNPVYIGKIRWNSRPTIKRMIDEQVKRERPRARQEDWILVDGLHEAIIDSETWNIAQEYLATNPPRPVPKERKVKNPLSGLIVCEMCGRKMVRRPYSGMYPETLMCPVTACPNISSQLCYVEEQLLQALKEWLHRYKVNWASINNNKPQQQNIQMDIKKKAVKKLDDELKNLEKQMDNLHDLLEQGVYTTDKFLERSRLLTDRVNQTRNEREILLADLQMDVMREENQKVIIPKVERVLDLYYAADDPAIRNELLKEVLEKAVYTKTTNGRWHNNPDDFELALYPKLPK